MIRKLKRQSPETIFRFLSHLGQQADVYANIEEDLCPSLKDKSVYVYSVNGELALVMIDTVLSGTKEQADLAFVHPLEPSYFKNLTTFRQQEKGEKRKSPLWSLFNAAKSVEELLNEHRMFRVKVHALLITNSLIVNYDEVREVISHEKEHFSMTVLHDCQTFCDQWSVLKLPLNQSSCLAGAVYLREYKCKLAGGMQDEIDEEEIAKLLADYVDEQDFSVNRNDDEKVDRDEDSLADEYGLDESALNVSTGLAACRTLNERKRFLIRYAKQQFFERVRR